MFGLSAGLPSAFLFARQRHFIARPPSMQASLEPTADVPRVLAAWGLLQRSASMWTQRVSISAVLGILVLVDHVLVDGEVHDLVDLGLLPCLAEGRQVLAGVSVQEELVLNHLEDVRGQAFLLGELVFRQRLQRGPRG